MDEEEGRIEPAVLYLACTRPAMKWGVPVEGFIFLCAFAWAAFWFYGHTNLATVRGWTSLFVFPVGIFLMRLMIESDHNIFRLWFLKMGTCGIRPNGVTRLWAVSKFRPSKARELASSV